MKKIYFLFACLACCCAMQAQEDEFIRFQPEMGDVSYYAGTTAGTAAACVHGLLSDQTVVVQDTVDVEGQVCVVTRYKHELIPVIWDDIFSQYAAIYLPNTIRQIDEDAFDRNDHLQAIHVAEDNPYYTTIDGVLYDKKVERLIACPQAKTDTLVLPKTVKKIRDKAFCNCHELSYIQVEEGNKTYRSVYGLLLKGNTLIAYPAKREGKCIKEEKKEVKKKVKKKDTASNLSSTTGWSYFGENIDIYSNLIYFYEGICHIPSCVHTIAPWAITCDNIYRFEVEEGHKQFSAVNGVLYSKNEKTLVLYPGQWQIKHILIPEGVTTIAPRAFYRNRHIHEVTLPTTLKKIGTEAFADMNDLHYMYNYSLRVPQRGKDAFRVYSADREILLFVPTQVEKYYNEKRWWGVYVYPLVYTNKDPEYPSCSVSVPDRLLVTESPGYDLSSLLYPYLDIIEHVQVRLYGAENSLFNRLTRVQDYEAFGDGCHWGISRDGVLFSSYNRFQKQQYSWDEDQEPDWRLIAFPPAKMGDYVVPDSVVDIVDHAFGHCHLSSLTISDNVKHVDLYINEADIENYAVTPGNSSYFAIDGVLFNQHGWLRAYPRRKQDSCYTVPMGAIGISVAAFMNNKHLQEVHITDSVQCIVNDAFYGCDNLTAVYINTITPPYIYYISPVPYWHRDCMVFPLDAKIYVPEESLETYKTDMEWKSYADRIFPMPKKEE